MSHAKPNLSKLKKKLKGVKLNFFGAQARKRRWSEPMRKEEEALDIEPPQVCISYLCEGKNPFV